MVPPKFLILNELLFKQKSKLRMVGLKETSQNKTV